ncbi:MAG TPA: TIM-barrel domain-containing protein [Dyella sp.]|uniref:glycoside hydrolase family 31 protein n=1 Tax=Dyella sp. TaxID=1869338 RepID=UPI002BD31EDF|nr:TIM-barrel domain-containing protein [Dyella sp.]HTV86825.1 TIM-barrel domain-containing protein [Dyella sp.]
MKRFRSMVLVALVGLVSAPFLSYAGTPGTTTVVAGDARFQFLTPSLVRLEYAPKGAFVDAPTAVVQKRDWPAVAVQTSRDGGWLVVRTRAMTLRYRLDSGPFTAANLQVTWARAHGAPYTWHPGQIDQQNLGGLTYSLDHVSADNLTQGGQDLESPANDIIPGIDIPLLPAKPGLLSRSGFAFIDDSQTPLWDARTQWIVPRATPYGQDGYLFTYDRQYTRVLQEYAQLCGSIPMIPRYTLGNWITDFNFEYFPDTADAHTPAFEHYNQQHLEDELARLRAYRIPFDTLVLDFAWHNYGWQGGYDWSPLIAHPAQFLQWLRDRGIKLSLNDHPGYAGTKESILSFSDSHAPEVLKALGRPLPPKPTFDMDISKGWKFAADPRDQGLQAHWYAADFDDRAWTPIRTDQSWQRQGHADDPGVGWYRIALSLPEKLPDAMYLYLGEVGQSYRIFVNGKEAAHSHVQWPRRLTYTDIKPYVRPGQRNEIALRVVSGEQGGGIFRGPVAVRDVLPPKRIAFNLADKAQAEIFMRDLHQPLMQAGVNSWWVDGGGGAADMPGLNAQLWTNKVFYDYSQQFTGQRGFILSRYGDWGSERYPGFFTGDTYSQWPVLAYEVAFTARGGNVLVPYISHDIGGFHGAKIDFDLYARWIEFGAFSPILRMHSAHANPEEGNTRMPWLYGDQGVALMRKYFTLRTQLIPYIYTYTWQAHTLSMPLLRPLYLAYPDLDEAYRHSREYFFGEEMLVAPVLDPSGNRSIYLPPGSWIDFFTGKRYAGGRSFTAHYAVDQMPVFVREGAIVPEQPPSEYSDAKPLDTLLLNIYGAGDGHFDLYEDDGLSLDYAKGSYALTTIGYATGADGVHTVTVAPAKGTYQGQPPSRAYVICIHALGKPQSVSANGRPISSWSWDANSAVATVTLPKQSVRDALQVTWR